MISIIVPTLWKSDMIYETIRDFKQSKVPGAELIIIDNLNSNYTADDDDIILVKPSSNIFVNPAWNLGVAISKNDTICLLNDDISINLTALFNNIPTDYGMIGFDANRNLTQTVNADNDIWDFEETSCRSLGFGCMMVMPKAHYEMIPPELQIYFGDDMLYWLNKDFFKRKVYNVKNLRAMGELSRTSKPYEHILQTEVHHFEKIISQLQQKHRQ
jgi:glycosyltransferase involved in cell wall biosynthesis